MNELITLLLFLCSQFFKLKPYLQNKSSKQKTAKKLTPDILLFLIQLNDNLGLSHKYFFNVGPPKEEILFWPPSMVFISDIITHILQIAIFHMLDLCGQLACTASTPVFLACGFLFWAGGVWLYSILLVLCCSFVLCLTLVRNVTCFPILIWQKWTKCRTKVIIHGNLVLAVPTLGLWHSSLHASVNVSDSGQSLSYSIIIHKVLIIAFFVSVY